MIEYHKNNEIERDQWDNCIKNSHSLKPYSYSWYLDIMAPGWEALVDDDYDSVFPIPCSTRFGIQYVSTPKFLQQLGTFSPDKPASSVAVEFLDYMPGTFKLIDLCVGQKADYDGYKVTERSNFELDLSHPYEKLYEGFTAECHRKIHHSARKKRELTEAVSPEELISLHLISSGSLIKGIKLRDYERLKTLMHYCINNKTGKIIGVRARRKRLIYGLFLIKIHRSITILLSAASAESRNNHIGHFVMNEIIKEYSSTSVMLDFACPSIPAAGNLHESFGSVSVPYYRIYRNRLLWPSRMIK